VSYAVKTETAVQRLINRKLVRYKINALTRNGRKELMDVLKSFFESEKLDRQHIFGIHYALVEIVFNALKANTKFVALREELRKRLTHYNIHEIESLLQIILEEKTLREYLAQTIMPTALKQTVFEIFALEEKYRTDVNNRLPPEKIHFLARFRRLIKEIAAEVILVIRNEPSRISLTVTNSVPILDRDMARINLARRRHQELHLEGKGGDFFSEEEMDTTESAGFGIAMVDQGLYKMELDPFEHLIIEARKRATIVTLTYPRHKLILSPPHSTP